MLEQVRWSYQPDADCPTLWLEGSADYLTDVHSMESQSPQNIFHLLRIIEHTGFVLIGCSGFK